MTLAVSDGFCQMFGYQDRIQAYADMNQNMFKDIHPDDTARFTNALLRFGSESGRLDVLYRAKKKDAAGYKIIHLLGEHVYAEDGPHLAQVWFTEEGDDTGESGSDLKRGFNQALRDEELKNAAYYDYLTGLPNMSYFFELAEVGRKTILDQDGRPALLYIDLSGMKSYNHKYGFSEGDKLLRYFAGLLSRTFGPDRCCHISADRFAAFADENGLEEQLNHMFREWRDMNNCMHLPICVGIYPNRMEAAPVGMAYDRAKIACDAIQGAYSSSFNYFSKAMSDGIVRQQYILDNFERALNENWIQVYYQPIVRAINGKVCDEEALARWIDPAKGLLTPAEFIPYLEDAGLVYRLDLYVLEKVLENIKVKESAGLYIVPHSINLSRSDFDACDMVEEIKRRVDAAGVSRDRISIEITESVIGSDFDFMKVQIERFQALGFPVWMDDFGSGYSSLDMLQSIKFNLLKFDMTFMKKLDESDDGRIILTELMKMASALGVDTICEGVETEEQVHFLQEIGCSKLQGFFFSQAAPIQSSLEYHKEHKLTGYENPGESAYYESICGLNLYDVSVVAREEKTSLRNTYSTLPMCIIEVKGDSTRFVRTNQSYRDFFIRFFALDPSNLGPQFAKYDAAFMYNVVKTCCEQGIRTFYDEKMPDGSIVHSFARRIGVNPITGTTAIAIAVLSIREPDEKLMTEQILTVIEQFGEHMPGGFYIYKADEEEALLYANKAVFDLFGCGSLAEFKALTGFTFRGMVHPEDYGRVSAWITDQMKTSQADVDSVEYRIIRKDGGIRWIDEYSHYVEYDDRSGLYYVFISDVTDRHEQAESDKALRSAVIEALTKAYDSVWLISDIETEKFELFRIDKETEHLMPANAAVKIEKFSQAFAFYSRLVLEEDRQRFLHAVAPESIVRNTETMLVYSVPFRRVFENGIRYYRVEFARLDLPGKNTGIVCGFRNMDEEVRRNQRIQHSLDQRAAVIEALTRPYDSVWIIDDMKTQRFELFRIDEETAHLIPAKEALKLTRFSDAFAVYSGLVLEEDRRQFLDRVSMGNIITNTQNQMIYSVPFRRVFEDGIRWYRVEFAKLDLANGDTKIVVGFKNVDEETRKNQ
ncbi:MAG: EAL domain-containing protein [Clostridia bacterium]|nr:EAL domain-containing protein [Clostridia bacterium]